MSGLIIIIAGAIFHIVAIARESVLGSGNAETIAYALYILGIAIAVFGYYYTPPRKKIELEATT